MALKPFGRKDNKSPLTYLRNKLLSPKLKLPRRFYRLTEFENHGSALEFREHLPCSIWDNYYKFAFVRNPFDWQVSHYHYILGNSDHLHHEEIVKCGSFKEYLKHECEKRLISSPNPMTHYVSDREGKVIVDKIGKLEELNRELGVIARQIGIEIAIQHMNKSAHRDFRSYYDTDSADLVREYHRKDFENFNYSMDI